MCEKVTVSTARSDWHSIDWKHATTYVRQLRQAIFLAGKEGELKKVRTLQRIMLRSPENRAIAVRQVTQINEGKATPGIDGEVALKHEERAALVDRLVSYRDWEPQPVRRIYIPKASGELRPLGLPTIMDRAVQALVKNALEPFWEAHFEGSSYGFRPGRSTHDAVEGIHRILNKAKRPWILDADIAGAFDNVAHDALLAKIGNFPARALIEKWLNAGYVEAGKLNDTPIGTPQGGVISPLLLNVALHGMEAALGVRYRKDHGAVALKHTSVALVRYADDFVVLCHSCEEALESQARLEAWLASIGLRLSQEKTRIVHIDDGFDFLGFTIRRFPEPRKRLGHKYLVRPSRQAQTDIRRTLKKMFRAHRGSEIEDLISVVNPIVRGWANYYRRFVSSKTFHSLDGHLYVLQKQWVGWRHRNKSKRWQGDKYWGPYHSRNTWVFGTSHRCRMEQFCWTHIRRHDMIRRFACWDDPALETYWHDRQRRTAPLSLTAFQTKVGRQQNYECPWCEQPLATGEQLVAIERPQYRGRLVRYVHMTCYRAMKARQKATGTDLLAVALNHSQLPTTIA